MGKFMVDRAGWRFWVRLLPPGCGDGVSR